MALPDDLARDGVCRLVGRRDALRHFAVYDGPTQSQQHVRPLHWYVACRLVLEGGFHPEELTPRPPLDVVRREGRSVLRFDPSKGAGGEATVMGGLKTKNVDVLVTKPQLGPVLAVSCQGMRGPLQDLSRRTEKIVGECANLHMAYPALVFGYLCLVRATEDGMVMATWLSRRRAIPSKRSPASMPLCAKCPGAKGFVTRSAATKPCRWGWSRCAQASPLAY